MKQPSEISFSFLTVVSADHDFRPEACTNPWTFRMVENGAFQVSGKVYAPGERRFAFRHPRDRGTYGWVYAAGAATWATLHYYKFRLIPVYSIDFNGRVAGYPERNSVMKIICVSL